jgi:hypothetical protein
MIITRTVSLYCHDLADRAERGRHLRSGGLGHGPKRLLGGRYHDAAPTLPKPLPNALDEPFKREVIAGRAVLVAVQCFCRVCL